MLQILQWSHIVMGVCENKNTKTHIHKQADMRTRIFLSPFKYIISWRCSEYIDVSDFMRHLQIWSHFASLWCWTAEKNIEMSTEYKNKLFIKQLLCIAHRYIILLFMAILKIRFILSLSLSIALSLSLAFAFVRKLWISLASIPRLIQSMHIAYIHIRKHIMYSPDCIC